MGAGLDLSCCHKLGVDVSDSEPVEFVWGPQRVPVERVPADQVLGRETRLQGLENALTWAVSGLPNQSMLSAALSCWTEALTYKTHKHFTKCIQVHAEIQTVFL